MMTKDNTVNDAHCCKTTLTRISWSALIAGALVGVGLGFLLNLFAVAISLSAYSASSDGASVIAIGGVLGFLIGVIASMGTAGFVAGYLGRFYHCYCHGGVIYGFITWSLALILSAMLVIPMIHYVAFYEGSLSSSEVTVPLMSSTTSSTSTTSTTKASKQTNKSSAPLATSPKHLAWSGWILFILFFVGAFSSCIGACYGMRCKWESVS